MRLRFTLYRACREQTTRPPFRPALEQVPDFVFNEDVVRVFPDMIKRSVPGYPTIVENLGVLAARFAQPHTALYDWVLRWGPLPSRCVAMCAVTAAG